MHEAFHIARSGRPGPVLVDVPVDVFRAIVEYDPDEVQNIEISSFKSDFKVHKVQVKLAVDKGWIVNRNAIYQHQCAAR